MKNLYASSLANAHYDAVVIGSGVGGLTVGVCLAKSGKKVLVLERHYVPGGFSHSFKRKNFEWDIGVHYVGRVEDRNSTLRKTFDYVTDGKLQWTGMGEIYDKAIIDGDEYHFVIGVENQIKKMISYFPEEEKAIRAYYDLINITADNSTTFFSEKTMPHWVSWFFGKLMKKGFDSQSHRTTYDVIRGFTSNEKLISVLCAQCGNYGLPPRKSSFVIHAMVVHHYLDGGSYPVGGASSIHRHMLKSLENNNGQLAIKAGVKRIILEKNKAIGVEMENGDKIYADQIISNAGVHNTFNTLLKDEEEGKKLCVAYNKVKASVAHVCLYVGLDASDEELNLPRHNFWMYDSYDFDGSYTKHINDEGSNLPLAYISFPSAKDPEWEGKHPGTSTIQVMTVCPYEWVAQWEETRWQKRGDEYDVFKEKYTAQLLEKLYKVVPQVKGHIVASELSTPLSTKYFSNYGKGEIYGLEHTPLRFGLKSLRPETIYKNLFLTGQDIVTVGVGGALFSGIIASTRILNRNMLWRINKFNQVLTKGN